MTSLQNLSNITLKRITGEIKQFNSNKPNNIKIYPNPDNILEIYFLIKGDDDSPFKDGHYICKLEHNKNYPFSPPNYYVLTPNGRFEVNKKICLTNSSYHKSDWAPAAWNLLTLLNGFYSIWHSTIKEDKIGISHLISNESRIISLASKSVEFNSKNFDKMYSYFI